MENDRTRFSSYLTDTDNSNAYKALYRAYIGVVENNVKLQDEIDELEQLCHVYKTVDIKDRHRYIAV